MCSYEFVVSVNPSDDPGQFQAPQQFLQSGWDVTQASPSTDDSRLLFHKRFSSVDDGRAELGRRHEAVSQQA
jgi:hypothetical protein